MTTYMMCSRNVESGSKSYWPIQANTEAEAFRQRRVAQTRVGRRFVLSFFRANTTPAEATERIEEARTAAANAVTMTAFLAMTKKAQKAFVDDGGTIAD